MNLLDNPESVFRPMPALRPFLDFIKLMIVCALLLLSTYSLVQVDGVLARHNVGDGAATGLACARLVGLGLVGHCCRDELLVWCERGCTWICSSYWRFEGSLWLVKRCSQRSGHLEGCVGCRKVGICDVGFRGIWLVRFGR